MHCLMPGQILLHLLLLLLHGAPARRCPLRLLLLAAATAPSTLLLLLWWLLLLCTLWLLAERCSRGLCIVCSILQGASSLCCRRCCRWLC